MTTWKSVGNFPTDSWSTTCNFTKYTITRWHMNMMNESSGFFFQKKKRLDAKANLNCAQHLQNPSSPRRLYSSNARKPRIKRNRERKKNLPRTDGPDAAAAGRDRWLEGANRPMACRRLSPSRHRHFAYGARKEAGRLGSQTFFFYKSLSHQK